jgi:hypothetical protein
MPCHRAIYHADRNLLATFDGADPELLVEQRETSVTASQMLFFLNHRDMPTIARFVAQRASSLAAQDSNDARVASAFKLLFARPPTATETANAERFLKTYSFERYCHTLLAANEFIYLD